MVNITKYAKIFDHHDCDNASKEISDEEVNKEIEKLKKLISNPQSAFDCKYFEKNTSECNFPADCSHVLEDSSTGCNQITIDNQENSQLFEFSRNVIFLSLL